MASNYAAITEYNERQLGRDTASRKTQISMYSDPTHFIFEILQNADDYEATEVSFQLSRRELVIEHNGLPFLEENVKAVTYFGKSTSRDDLVKTGRFGVGFKSVFAFTATPIIISGGEHFRIHGLYRLDEHPYPEGLERKRTRITLPFNHETELPDYVDDHIPAPEAYKLIAERLSGLNMNTLLFTRNIVEIRWETVDKSGHYLREDKTTKGARHTSITNGDAIASYLVFARTPIWKGQEHKDVELAFQIDSKGLVAPVDENLYVLFTTTQETHLKFIINGPYRTNPSRETISEEDTFNLHLIKETCELLQFVLPSLRDGGLLNMNSLAAMPIEADSLREFYSPILNAVIKCFCQDDLVPTDKDTFAPAAKVMQGPAPIRDVISDKELAVLSAKEGALWAKGVAPGSRADQFLKSLAIEQWGWKELEAALVFKYGGYKVNGWTLVVKEDASWLEARSDQWLQKLYMLLAEAIRKDECDGGKLSMCCIIRTTISKEVAHKCAAHAYFPKGRGYQDLTQVKKSILAGKTPQLTKKVEDALLALGVREIGTEERIDLILENYYQADGVEVTPELHLQHMSLFLKAWKMGGAPTQFLNKAIFCDVGGGNLESAGSYYLDSPFMATGLGAIYKQPRKGIDDKHKLWSGYRELIGDGFCEFAIACGVEDCLSIERQDCCDHPNRAILRQDYNQYGVKYTHTAINLDYTIKGLQGLLGLRDLGVNRLIWDAVRNAAPEVLCATFRPNRQYDLRHDQSSLVIILSKAEWIPDKNGKLRKPSVMMKAELHPSFPCDNRNGWLDEIGFGEADKQASEAFKQKKEFAKQWGLNIKMIDALCDMPKEKQEEYLERFKNEARADAKEQKKQEEALPFHEAVKGAFLQIGGPQAEHEESGGRSSKNPGRRKAKLGEEISAELAGASSTEDRFTIGLCKKWKAKNDQVKARLISWYGGKCQICDRTFTQRNNQPYFEGLYLVPHTKAKWIDRAGNVLCLCPWHSAMFQFGSKEVEGDIQERILGFVPTANGGNEKAEIAVRLCGESITIGYHEDHFIELQAMVEESLRSHR